MEFQELFACTDDCVQSPVWGVDWVYVELHANWTGGYLRTFLPPYHGRWQPGGLYFVLKLQHVIVFIVFSSFNHK